MEYNQSKGEIKSKINKWHNTLIIWKNNFLNDPLCQTAWRGVWYPLFIFCHMFLYIILIEMHSLMLFFCFRCWQLTCRSTWACWRIWRRWWKRRKWPDPEFSFLIITPIEFRSEFRDGLWWPWPISWNPTIIWLNCCQNNPWACILKLDPGFQ